MFLSFDSFYEKLESLLSLKVLVLISFGTFIFCILETEQQKHIKHLELIFFRINSVIPASLLCTVLSCLLVFLQNLRVVLRLCYFSIIKIYPHDQTVNCSCYYYFQDNGQIQRAFLETKKPVQGVQQHWPNDLQRQAPLGFQSEQMKRCLELIWELSYSI